MRHAGSGLPLRRCGGTRLYVLGSRQGQAPWPNGTVVKDCTLNIGKSVAASHSRLAGCRRGNDGGNYSLGTPEAGHPRGVHDTPARPPHLLEIPP